MKTYCSNEPKSKLIKEYRKKSLFYHEEKSFLSLTEIIRVDRPLISISSKLLAQEGYLWLQTFRPGKNYSITTIFDQDRRIVEWYIDLVKDMKLDLEKASYVDLYLDLVIGLEGEIYILDQDELDQALLEGDISRKDYDLALAEKEGLVETFKSQESLELLRARSLGYLKLFEED